jgi:RHS repeat-associated protein
MGRLTSLQASNGTRRTKTWNATAGTLDGYNWNVTGKTARGLGWDVRGNLISQSKDGFNSSYVYDQLSRLEYAQEGGNIETLTDSTMPQGSQQRDVGGAKGLDFSNPGANVKLDYYSSSIGVDLSSSQYISKVRLIGVSPRIQPRTVEVYISQDGVNGDWTKLTDTTWLQDETGVTLQLGALHQAQFVKLHMTWDERDQNNQPVDQHTLAGTVGQLLQVWYDVDGQTTSFTYDSLGNRVLENQTRAHSVQTDYTYYPNSSRIQQAGNWEFDYDANGNMTSRGNSGTTDATTGQFDWNQTQGELWLYGYDLKNRLVSVQHGLSGSASLQSVAQYTYDLRDLRVETVKPVATTYTQYDQTGDLLWHDNGAQTRKYIEALGQIWAEVRTTGTNSQVYFHHADHEGSTDVITDSSGNIVWDGDYEAFGAVVRSNGTIRFDASYTGKEFDVDTGLYYFNARWYDPTLGRFITEDPAKSGNNWFAYCDNNPMSFTDPTGLFPVDQVAMMAQGTLPGYSTEQQAQMATAYMTPRTQDTSNSASASTPSPQALLANIQSTIALPQYQPGYPDTNGNTDTTWCNAAANHILVNAGVNTNPVLNNIPGTTTPSIDWTNANSLLSNIGSSPQWGSLTAGQAYNRANLGLPVLAGATGSPGHVGIVAPSSQPFNAALGPMIGQAGTTNGIFPAASSFTQPLSSVHYYYPQ